ncbi:hypothetical protein MAC_03747 [Metarhizium acridum CQMa 102]|uniref:Uncharacterized protein n=1 Tax=Metarhizium acridum (strain CQMa 102) TaxID=655827 RepID=E9E1J9_METAQ|nr:uncharacterized protein MAC_03747 [Metarhizium acridum CQMa 102]EFY90232.1 hypothetical protein MAC_03747 [Metarhizium acridum CQMa 102]
MTTADANLAIPVPWDRLLLWVQQQIALEMRTGQPVALTRSQLEALSEFVPFNEEPNVSDQGYVSKLVARSAAITPGKLLRMGRPAISPLQLPKPHIPSPQDMQPLSKRQRLSANSPVPGTTPSKSPWTSVPSTRSPSNSSVFEEVSSLCNRLALGSPTYKIEPDPAGHDVFCGRPVFKNDLRIPPDLGIVSGIAGEGQAKLKVAESVREWLQAELQRRQDTFESLWSTASSPKPATPNVQ